MFAACSSSVRLLRLLAVLVVGLAPVPALAENAVVFRNDCRAPVIVQSAMVVRGVIRRERPYLLRPGDVSPKLSLDADKIIIVYDGANPNRVLFQDNLKVSTTDLYYGIVPDVVPNRVRMIRRSTPPAGMAASGDD